MPTMNGAEIIIRQLERHGITVVAGIPGGANLPLYDALAASTTIRHVLARHEQGAGFIAQGMARATGRPAVCFATSGPGATNVLTALADAAMDSVPMVCITGQVARPLLGTSAFQEVDICAMARPAIKAVFAVHEAGELAATVAEALHLAGSGRPGPVLVDVPKDVQLERISCADWPDAPATMAQEPLPEEALQAAVDLIDRAERPMLYLGGGVVRAGGAGAARRLAEQGDMPAVMTLMGLGTLPAAHPLSLGLLGMHGARSTNLAMAECDLLIAIGARFDDRVTGRVDAFSPNSKKVHIDIDPSSINKIVRVDVPIVADCGIALEALLAAVKHRKGKRPDLKPWKAEIDAWRARNCFAYEPSDTIIKPQFAIERLYELTRERDPFITTEVGQHQMWAAQFFHFDAPNHWMTSGGLGTMGYGLPAAVGVQCAHPDALVIDIAGEASIQMMMQELSTAVQFCLPVKVFILNNEWMGMVRQWQELLHGERYSHSWSEALPDFVKLAEAFGAKGFKISDPKDLDDAIIAMIEHDGPVILDCLVEKHENCFPMIPSGEPHNKMLLGDASTRDAIGTSGAVLV